MYNFGFLGFFVIDLFRYITLIDKGALYFSSLLLFSDKSLLQLYCNNQSDRTDEA